jgi:hypothetical protein
MQDYESFISRRPAHLNRIYRPKSSKHYAGNIWGPTPGMGHLTSTELRRLGICRVGRSTTTTSKRLGQDLNLRIFSGLSRCSWGGTPLARVADKASWLEQFEGRNEVSEAGGTHQ